jgi:cytochrome P450
MIPLPPGPGFRATFGLLKERRDPLRLFQNVARDYGDVALLRFGPTKIVVLSHPDHVRWLLQDGAERYYKGWIYDSMRAVLGNGLISSDGALWKKQRKLVAPAFHRAGLEKAVGEVVASADAAFERWEALGEGGKSFDLHAECLKLTLEIAVRALLGVRLDAGRQRAFIEIIDYAVGCSNRRLMSPLPLPMRVPTPANIRLRRSVRRLDELIYEMMDGRDRAEGAGDLLSLLLATRDEDGQPMPRRQVRDEVVTMMVAGYETSSAALAWCFSLLARHPEVRAKLAEEAARAPETPSFESSLALPYANAVLEESMRLYPPAWLYGRHAAREDEIGGFRIPKGAITVVSPYVVHRDPRFWSDPETFRPERFLSKAEPRHRFAYIPFSAGPRQCLGMGFAMLEMTIILSRAVRRFELALSPDASLETAPRVALEPRHGIRVMLTPTKR